MIEHALTQNVHREPRLMLELSGSSDVFRFAVNMLDDQTEFYAAGRVVLVELREIIGEAFDPWAKSLLGDDRYRRLSPHFLRDEHCVSCEKHVTEESPQKLPNAAIVCRECSPEAAQ